MVRRTLAIGAGLVLLILLVLLFRGCLDARNERAVKDYVADTNELIEQSDAEATQLFELLGGEGDPVDAQNAANGLRSDSATLADRAADLDPPDELSDAQGYFLDAMELRRDGITRISQALPGALADEARRESTQSIAAVMPVFLASDVLLDARFRPSLERTLEDEGVAGEVSVVKGEKLRFVPDIQWLQPDFVSEQVAGLRSGEGGTDGTAAPGLHGNGLGTVTLGGVALVPGATATVPLTDDVAFDIQVTNQGENTETDVPVRVRLGEGDEASEQEETIPEIAVGETKTVTVPLAEQPAVGENVPVQVEVEAVPGEENTDNNAVEFTVIFTS